jgi:serine/threonine protein kinase
MTVPRRLDDRYALGELIGRGASTEVYRARDEALGGRAVAARLLRLDLLDDPREHRRFHRSVPSTSLAHPHLLSVYDKGEQLTGDGKQMPWLVQELVEGLSVDEWTSDPSTVALDRPLRIVADVCAGLSHLHTSGLLHGDITARSVMLTFAGHVKVNTFGMVQRDAVSYYTEDDDTDEWELPRDVVDYLAPERTRAEPFDLRADLYSAGCLLYDLVAGRPPFIGESAVAVALQHVSAAPVTPSTHCPSVPATVDRVVMRALSKDPRDRFQTAAAMRVALLSVDSASSAHDKPASKAPARGQRPWQAPPRQEPAVRRRPAPPPAAAPPTARAQVVTIKNAEVLRHKPGPRRQEDLGDEVYTFDNSKSDSTSTETIRIAHTARIEVDVDLSKARSVDGHVRLQFPTLAAVEGRIRSEILEKHRLSLKDELFFEQTTTISIPARTSVRVVFHWKRVWEEGTVVLGHRASAQAEVPYAITVMLSFDKETSDHG